MTHTQLKSEPYEISVRFWDALRAKALRLEADAHQDELVAAALEHPSHLQRQKLLVQTQREDAARLRNFLAGTRIRSK
jgi:hypothetical protein